MAPRINNDGKKQLVLTLEVQGNLRAASASWRCVVRATTGHGSTLVAGNVHFEIQHQIPRRMRTFSHVDGGEDILITGKVTIIRRVQPQVCHPIRVYTPNPNI